MVDFRIDVVVDPSGVRQGVRQTERQLGRLETRADSLRSKLSGAFAALGGAAAIGGAVRTLATFDQAVANAGARAEATSAQLQQFSDRARELGATTRFTATDAANGLAFLAQAGFTVNDSLETVDDALRLAQVGNLSLAESADIASNVLTGFGLGAEGAGRFVDVLAKAASSSNTNVRQLGDAFSFVAPIASGVGVEIEEAAAAIGVLSNAGIQGSRAGTGLQRVISRLSNPTKEAQTVLSNLGLTQEDVNVSTQGLTTVLQRLADSGISATQALVVAGDRGGPAITALTRNVGDIERLGQTFNEAGGFAEEAARRLDDTLLGALRRVASAFEAVILSVGEAGASGGLRSAIEGVASGLRVLAENGSTVLASLQTLGTFLIQVFIARALRGVLTGIRAIGIAIATNPIGALATAVTAVTAVLVGFRNEIQASTDGIATLGDVFAVTIEALQQVAQPIFEGLIVLFNETFGTGFQISIRGFVEAAAFGFDRFLGIVRGTVFAVRSLFSTLFLEVLGELAIEGVNLILAGFESLLDGVRAIFNTIISLTRQLLSALLQFARLTGEAVQQALSGNVDIAARFAADAQTAFNRAVSNFDPSRVTAQFRKELQALSQDRTIDEIDNQFAGAGERLGQTVSDSFRAGFEAETITGFVSGIFDEAEGRAQARAEAAGRAAASRGQAAGAGGGSSSGAPNRTPEEAERTVSSFERLQTEIDALDQRRDFGAGLSRGFKRLQQEALDLAAVGEQVTNVFADSATDAILEFVETGKFSFRDFANDILQQLLRIIIRLLVVQALNAAVGGAGGAVATGVSAGAGAAARQSGGPVQPGRTFLVGERGPELFSPSRGGSITPNNELMAAPPPQEPPVVNNIIVSDPNEIPEGINSGKADSAIVNVIARNRDQVRQVTQ